MGPTLAIIILAAGQGTRMQSHRAKVLHEIAGKPMSLYVVETALQVGGAHVILVIGTQAEAVRATVSPRARVQYVYQEKQLGTGHAVLCALPHVPPSVDDIMVLYGDVPLVSAGTVRSLLAEHRENLRDVSLLAVEMQDPTGYGRVLLDAGGRVCGIVEEADATEEQKRIRMINTGILCARKTFLQQTLPTIQADNAQGEVYLTDVVEVAFRRGANIGLQVGRDARELFGVNSAADLVRVENLLNERRGIIP